jgi:tRNA dimethylallyltransferase
VAGPTGVGKTSLAVLLAASLRVEVVSVDSRQVYRRLDIGTAKPDQAQRAAVPHHLIDIVEPDGEYNAGRFAADARRAITHIRSRGAIPLLVGGTGLYLRALAEGMLNAPPSDPAVRRRLKTEAAEAGSELHARLTARDPETAARIHPRDEVRVVRALEIIETSGRTLSDFRAETRAAALPLTVFALRTEREPLYRRLDERVARMMAAGLADEVRGLLADGYDERFPAMRCIGYGRLVDSLKGRSSPADAVEGIKKDTRNLAKRQMTWFRGMPGVVWLDVPPDGDPSAAARVVLEALTRSGGDPHA